MCNFANFFPHFLFKCWGDFKKKIVKTYLFANVVGSTTAFNIPKKLPQIKGKIMIFNEFSFLKYENKITKFEICATTKIY